MKLVWTFLIFSYALPAFAAKYPQNTFVLYDERSDTKLTANLPVDLTEPAQIFVSRPNFGGPETILMEAKVKNSFVAANPRDPKDFPSLSMHLGRSGEIFVRRSKDGSCVVRSTMREFFFPAETLFETCSYFYGIGTKPGLSGSN